MVALDLSILAQSAITLQAFFFSLKLSLSNLLLSYSMWMRMVEVWNVSFFVAKYSALIHKFATQNRWNCAETKQSQRKTQQSGGKGCHKQPPRLWWPPRAVAATIGSPWWWLSPPLSCFRFAASSWFVMGRGICYSVSVLGHFGSS